jgi:hypothetical protein
MDCRLFRFKRGSMATLTLLKASGVAQPVCMLHAAAPTAADPDPMNAS